MKVLVVDDNELLAENLCEVLEDAGYEAEFTPSAEDALQRGCFDVYVSDVRMPGLDGWELRSRVLECCPHARVLLMTAYAEPGARPASTSSVVPLSKPVPIHTLLEHLG